ncbi:DUF6169 family protein [Spirosoma areae]
MSPNPYKFEYIGGLSNAYVFETTAEVIYQIKFKSTPYLFPDESNLGQDVFELVIDVVYTPAGKLPLDASIPATIAAICKDFFADKERILLYICETADARHLARVRKFDAWFREFKDAHFVKIDANFPDADGITYYVSLIFRWSHPQRHTIMDEFNILAQRYDTNK